jgi:hypothetical protein
MLLMRCFTKIHFVALEMRHVDTHDLLLMRSFDVVCAELKYVFLYSEVGTGKPEVTTEFSAHTYCYLPNTMQLSNGVSKK